MPVILLEAMQTYRYSHCIFFGKIRMSDNLEESGFVRLQPQSANTEEEGVFIAWKTRKDGQRLFA